MRRGPGAPSAVFVVVPALIALVATLALTVPYFLFLPGPTTDVAPIVSVVDAPTHPVNGELLLTTVRVRSLSTCGERVRTCLPVADLVYGWLSPNIDVVPRRALVAPGESQEEADERSEQEMDRSQLAAAAAALSLLGYDVNAPRGVEVVEVAQNRPASGVLSPGDVVIQVGDRTVCGVGELTEAVGDVGVGSEVTMRVLRDGEDVTVTTTTVADPETGRPIVGIVVTEPTGDVDLPLDIRIKTEDIGGPSAGLVFALTLVDLLTEEDITKGRAIAGTGSIAPAGCVGGVGGIRQKVLGAREDGASLFLVPPSEVEGACAVAGTLPVHEVRTLADAVEVLRSGGPDACEAPRPPEAGGRSG